MALDHLKAANQDDKYPITPAIIDTLTTLCARVLRVGYYEAMGLTPRNDIFDLTADCQDMLKTYGFDMNLEVRRSLIEGVKLLKQGKSSTMSFFVSIPEIFPCIYNGEYYQSEFYWTCHQIIEIEKYLESVKKTKGIYDYEFGNYNPATGTLDVYIKAMPVAEFISLKHLSPSAFDG